MATAKLTYVSIAGLALLTLGISLFITFHLPGTESIVVPSTLVIFGAVLSILSIADLLVDEARLPILGIGLLLISFGGLYFVVAIRRELTPYFISILIASLGLTLLLIGIKRTYEF